MDDQPQEQLMECVLLDQKLSYLEAEIVLAERMICFFLNTGDTFEEGVILKGNLYSCCKEVLFYLILIFCLVTCTSYRLLTWIDYTFYPFSVPLDASIWDMMVKC